MSTLKDVFQRIGNATVTTNGNFAYKTTLSANLDFFAMSMGDGLSQFQRAYAENKHLALANLLYARDREAKGFRRQTREILFWLADNSDLNNSEFYTYATQFASFGRWDDLVGLLISNRALEVANLLYNQLVIDMSNFEAGNSISLLAKWMPSINASKGSRKLALRFISLCNKFTEYEITPQMYRRTLSKLRSAYGLVETKLTKGEVINFDAVPAKAIYKYKKAFSKMPHYQEWLKSRKTIKSTAMQVYELCRDVHNSTNIKMWDSLVAKWKEQDLPSFLVMGDVSGSMQSPTLKNINVTPIDISISLALFSAYVNPLGITMTFTEEPKFFSLGDKSLAQAYNELTRNVGYNTNLEKSVTELLKYCKKYNVAPQDMPKFLIIVSDMQFDKFGSRSEVQGWDDDIQSQLSYLYNQAGYELPKIVYWQVNNYNNKPVVKDSKGAMLIGGFNQNLLKQVLTSNMQTPEEHMLEVLAKYLECL